MAGDDRETFRRATWIAAFGAFALCATALCAFGLFIWPTPYRYEKVTRTWRGSSGAASSYDEVYRINRLTGASEKIVEAGK